MIDVWQRLLEEVASYGGTFKVPSKNYMGEVSFGDNRYFMVNLDESSAFSALTWLISITRNTSAG